MRDRSCTLAHLAILYDGINTELTHYRNLLQVIQIPNRRIHELRLHPPRRASLNRDVASETTEHFLHFRRQHLERLARPVPTFGADLLCFAEQAAARPALWSRLPEAGFAGHASS